MKQLYLTVAFIWLAMTVKSMPASPSPFVYTQPDGSTCTLLVAGDEHVHLYMTPTRRLVTFDTEGYAHFGERVEASTISHRLHAMRRSARQKTRHTIRRAPTTGTAKGLIILVDFSDRPFEDNKERIFREMNEEGYSENGATGSARDYFISQSMGMFTPVFDVVGPVTMEFPYRYYGSNRNDEEAKDNAPKEMIFNATKAAQAQGLIDIDSYDGDGDGYVDMVYVIYAGKGEADGGGPNTIWPHMSDIQSDAQFAFQTIEGKRLSLYACSAEKRGDGTFSGIGTFCHEYGHCLGLPDMYDTDYSGGFGLGDFDIMSGGGYNNKGNTPPAYSAFERYTLGWLELVELDTDQNVTLQPLTSSNTAYRISTDREEEFFTVENRQYQDWDLYLPSRGLMITHIYYDESVWQENKVNDDPEHPHVRIMAADNVWSRSTQNGDLYPGTFDNHEFSDTSTPSAVLWDGQLLHKSLSDIQLAGINVTFHFHTEPNGIAETTYNRRHPREVYITPDGIRWPGKPAWGAYKKVKK